MKRIIKTILLLCISLSLCGCHGSKTESVTFAVPEEFDESKNYEISFWAKNDSNKYQVAVYEDAIKQFNEYYPNIKVNLKLYTDYTLIYNDVITNIATDTTPNVCITFPDHIATYLTGNNIVTPLDDLMVSEKYGLGGSEVKFDSVTKEEVIKEYLNEGYINGNLYQLPFMRSSEATYINADLVKKLGYEIPDVLTWEYIWEVSEKALEMDSEGNYLVNGQKTLIPFIYKSTDNMTIQMMKQAGYAYSDDNGNIQMFSDDLKKILLDVASHAKSGAFSTFKIASYPANYLNAGQCIFAVDSTAGSTWMGSKAPLIDIPQEDLVEFETVVRPVPQYDVSNPYMMSQGPSICIFNKQDPQVVLASWLFGQFLLTNTIQNAYAQTEGYIPVTSKAQNSEEYKQYLAGAGSDNNEHYDIKIQATELLLNNIENTFVTSVFNGSTSLRLAAGQVIEETAKAARRKKTIDDAFFEQLYADMISLYRLDQLN